MTILFLIEYQKLNYESLSESAEPLSCAVATDRSLKQSKIILCGFNPTMLV